MKKKNSFGWAVEKYVDSSYILINYNMNLYNIYYEYYIISIGSINKVSNLECTC